MTWQTSRPHFGRSREEHVCTRRHTHTPHTRLLQTNAPPNAAVLLPFRPRSPCCPPPTWPFAPAIFFIVDPSLIDTRPVSILQIWTEEEEGEKTPSATAPTPHRPSPVTSFTSARLQTRSKLNSIDYHSAPCTHMHLYTGEIDGAETIAQMFSEENENK